MRHTLIIFTSWLSLSILSVLSVANASLELDSQSLHFPSRSDTHSQIASADVATASMLNYRTAAADLMWISTILDHTLTVSSENRVSRALTYNVRQLLEVDARFYPAYEWYAAANLTRRARISEAVLEETNSVLDIGIEEFPSDPNLPHVAALNYIGYSDPRDHERRIRELTRGASYLQEAARRPDPPSNTPLVLGWMQDRVRKLKGKAGAEIAESEASRREDIQYNKELYLMAQSPELRAAIVENLKALGEDTDEIFATVQRQQDELTDEHTKDAPFVGLNLWLSLGGDLSNADDPS